MKIKAHSRHWKAWARRMAHFCRYDACWLDPVCLWAKMHRCCPQHSPKVFGGWKYACKAVQEGQWTHVCRHPRLMHWWLDGMDAEIRSHMGARGLPVPKIERGVGPEATQRERDALQEMIWRLACGGGR